MRRRFSPHIPALALAFLSIVVASCGPQPDIKTALKVVPTLTGYYDDGPSPDGQNRLLPSITFQLKNEGDQPLANIDLVIAYWEVGADGANDDKQIRGIEGTPLEPGKTSDAITVRASIGYTSPAARADFFINSRYRGFVVKLFAKYRGKTTRLGEWPVEARLIPAAHRDGARP